MTLGENIKARRTQLKFSQEYVADQLGLSRQAVAKWESGKSEPTAANLSELAILLETSVSQLVNAPPVSTATQSLSTKEKRRNAKMLLSR